MYVKMLIYGKVLGCPYMYMQVLIYGQLMCILCTLGWLLC
jgi:hypothetical protein